MNIRKLQLAGFMLVMFASLVFAQMSNIRSGVCVLWDFISTIIPIIVMLMLVGAGAVYAGGQMMGDETRARANVWATAMLTGALIGVLITVIAPSILTTMYGETEFNSAINLC